VENVLGYTNVSLSRKMDNKVDRNIISYSIHSRTAAGGLTGGKPQVQIFIMGLDALGGYVFARMAHNEGILPFPSISKHANYNNNQ
jgi:hypothetical protein